MFYSRTEPCIIYNIESLLCVVIVMAAVEHVTKLSRQNSAKKKSLGNCMDVNCKNVVGSP